MNKLKARFSKKQEVTPLTEATKEFIKTIGDQGLQALPFILESCSSASEFSLTSQIEVLDLITKYYAQNQQVQRQLRCIDLLRYLSDQRDNELFGLLAQNHPLLKHIDSALKVPQLQSPLQKGTRILLDHLVRQPRVPESIIQLHAKHVNGFSKPHKPTIILSDQEVVADDIAAAEAESELLVALITDSSPDESLLKEVYERITSTKERLIRDIDTSTSESQTTNLINSIEGVERVLALYQESRSGSIGLSRRNSSAKSFEDPGGYSAPVRADTGRRISTESQRRKGRSNGKSKASPPSSPLEKNSLNTGSPFLYPSDAADDRFGEGSSSGSVHMEPDYSQDYEEERNPFSTAISPSLGDHSDGPRHVRNLSSNNPFAAKSGPSRSFSPSNPYNSQLEPTKEARYNPFESAPSGTAPLAAPFQGHSEGDLTDQWQSLRL